MKKTLNDLYLLMREGELKKEDLVRVEDLFDEAWEKRYFANEEYDDLDKEYEATYDPSFAYGILSDIFVTICNFSNYVKLEFFGSFLDCASERDCEVTIKITNEVKNELEKMGIPKSKKLDDSTLNSAAFEAVKKIIISQEISIFKDEAK